jgi:hypothetical protein
MNVQEVSCSSWGVFVSNKRGPSQALLDWVEETERVNEALIAQGVEPKYRCWIKGRKLKEWRAD